MTWRANSTIQSGGVMKALPGSCEWLFATT